MGKSSSEFAAYVMEQLAPVGEVTGRRFFGGVGLKSASALFAMIMDGTLYFAVDDASRPQYERRGSRCFSFDSKKGRVDVKRFFEVPADILEEQDALVAFARTAIAAARRAALTRKPRARRAQGR